MTRPIFNWERYQKLGFEDFLQRLGDGWSLTKQGNSVEVSFREKKIGEMFAVHPQDMADLFPGYELLYVDRSLDETTSCLIIKFELMEGEDEPWYVGPSPKDLDEAAELFRERARTVAWD